LRELNSELLIKLKTDLQNSYFGIGSEVVQTKSQEVLEGKIGNEEIKKSKAGKKE
jgi:hypothetical protein